MTRPARIAILGAGRAGCALHRALEQAGCAPTLLWTRSERTAAAARSDGFPALSGPLPTALRDADLVFLAVSDRAVAELAQELARSPVAPSGAVFAHLAGALDLSPLAPLQRLGHVGSLHFLTSIAARTDRLGGAFAAVAGADEATDQRLSEVATLVGASLVRPRGDRARYHAAACVVGNYPQVLMESALRLLSDSGLDPDEARRMLAPLLRSATEHAIERAGAAALSGPVVRGDTAVVAKQLSAMDADPALEEVARLYRAAAAIGAEVAGTTAVIGPALRRTAP